MIDIRTNEPLRVLPVEDAGSYIRLAYSQTEEVLSVLRRHNVRHWLSEDVIAWEDETPEAFIFLEQVENPERVQTILDATP